MSNVTIRKEVRLSKEILDSLELLAAKKKWSLKKTMEEILISHASRVSKPQKQEKDDK